MVNWWCQSLFLPPEYLFHLTHCLSSYCEYFDSGHHPFTLRITQQTPNLLLAMSSKCLWTVLGSSVPSDRTIAYFCHPCLPQPPLLKILLDFPSLMSSERPNVFAWDMKHFFCFFFHLQTYHHWFPDISYGIFYVLDYDALVCPSHPRPHLCMCFFSPT